MNPDFILGVTGKWRRVLVWKQFGL